MEKRLAKIKYVKFGYHEYLFGLSLELGGESWGVGADYHYNPSYKGDTTEGLIDMTAKVQKLLKAANVETVDKLLNMPVECIFDGNLLKDFRILSEVI